MAASEAYQEAVRLRSLLGEILDNGKFTVEERDVGHLSVLLRCNNQGAFATILKGVANPLTQTKDMDIRRFYARKVQELRIVLFVYLKSTDNKADIFTKT